MYSNAPLTRLGFTLLLATLLLAEPAAAQTPSELLARKTSDPPMASWMPTSERLGSFRELIDPVIPDGDRFTNLHGGLRSSDEVSIALAPVFEPTWTAETNAFVAESPTFDAKGDAYFVPLIPTEGGQNMLIKLDGETGEREWAITREMVGDATLNFPGLPPITIPAVVGQGGAPLILDDPVTGKSIAYTGSYAKAFAVDEDGEIVWNSLGTPTSLIVHRALPPGTHLYGVQYHPQSDTVIYEYGAGDLVAYDRSTGERLGWILMPGAPSASVTGAVGELIDQLPEDARDLARELLREAFAESLELPSFEGAGDTADTLVDSLLGGGTVIANHFAVDPDSGALWVASTDLDEADGTADGVSEFGALYRLDITRVPRNGRIPAVSFEIGCKASFIGGTTSTPAISPDGARIYTTDNQGRALAFDRDCNEVWSVDTGEPAVASLAVSSHRGAEIYYPSARSIIKLQENEARDGAEVVWHADLAASFRGGSLVETANELRAAIEAGLETRLDREFPDGSISIGIDNLDLATIAANGIAVHAGFGVRIATETSDLMLPIALNVALYDRETGAFINGAPAVEENIGAMYVSPDGTIAMGSSPVRRIVTRAFALLPETLVELPEQVRAAIDRVVPPITGGVTKYGVVESHDLIVRDATCAAAAIARNLQHYDIAANPVGLGRDRQDLDRLLVQAEEAIPRAIEGKELPGFADEFIAQYFTRVRSAMESLELSAAESELAYLCGKLQR